MLCDTNTFCVKPNTYLVYILPPFLDNILFFSERSDIWPRTGFYQAGNQNVFMLNFIATFQEISHIYFAGT